MANEEFADQVTASWRLVAAGLRARAGAGPAAGAQPDDPYVASEQSLVLGHRYHPAPKARCRPLPEVLRYAPEVGARFPLRHLAVRAELVRQECEDPAFADVFDRAAAPAQAPDGYAVLPVHPWQLQLLGQHPGLLSALRDRRLVDLGPAGPAVVPTASVRTVHHPGLDAFLKLSLSVRITNCVRRHADYELAAAVALSRILRPVAADLAARYPGTAVLAEPAYRTVAVAGHPDLTGELGVIARDGLRRHLLPGVTALLRRAGGTVAAALTWWEAYLCVLLPPVLHAYFEHGVVFEPHLQNVVVGVDPDGMPAQALLRDMEGTKLIVGRRRDSLAGLPVRVRAEVGYDAERGWDRVVYCLFVNHLHEIIGVLADRHPAAERLFWGGIRDALLAFRRSHGCSARLRALLSGVPLPAKANLLTGRRGRRRRGRISRRTGARPRPATRHPAGLRRPRQDRGGTGRRRRRRRIAVPRRERARVASAGQTDPARRRHGGRRPRSGQERGPEPDLQELRRSLSPGQGLPDHRLAVAPCARQNALLSSI